MVSLMARHVGLKKDLSLRATGLFLNVEFCVNADCAD